MNLATEGKIAGLLRLGPTTGSHNRNYLENAAWVHYYADGIWERGARYTGPPPARPDWAQCEADELRERRLLDDMAGG